MAMFGHIRKNRNAKSWRSERLCDRNFGGTYELDDGSIMDLRDSDECDVWYMLGSGEHEPDNAVGALEYDIYRDGKQCESGATAYLKKDRMSDLETFVRNVEGHGGIAHRISRDTAPNRSKNRKRRAGT